MLTAALARVGAGVATLLTQPWGYILINMGDYSEIYPFFNFFLLFSVS